MANHPARTAGIALGLLYLLEAVVATGLLFFVWPILGGIFAAALLRWNPATPLTPGSGAKCAAKAALIGGLILLVVGTPLTAWLLKKLDEPAGMLGMTFELPLAASVLLIFLIYAAFGLLVAAAAGAVTGLFNGGRTRSAE